MSWLARDMKTPLFQDADLILIQKVFPPEKFLKLLDKLTRVDGLATYVEGVRRRD